MPNCTGDRKWRGGDGVFRIKGGGVVRDGCWKEDDFSEEVCFLVFQISRYYYLQRVK